MSRYASAGGGPLNASREFKEMVKALHAAGIEVNHVFNQLSTDRWDFTSDSALSHFVGCKFP